MMSRQPHHQDLAEQLDQALEDLHEGRPTNVPEELDELLGAASRLRSAAARQPVERSQAQIDHQLARVRSFARQHVGGLPPGPVRVASATRAPETTRPEVTWRRRALSIAVAAALLAVPATLVSAESGPGDPLYALKLGVEQVRIATSLSPEAEAEERTRIAQIRLDELNGLIETGQYDRVPGALSSLEAALTAAEQATARARSAGEDSTLIASLEAEQAGLAAAQQETLTRAVTEAPPNSRDAILTTLPTQPTAGPATTVVGNTPTTECNGRGCGDGGLLEVDPTTTNTPAPSTTQPSSTTTQPPVPSSTTPDGAGATTGNP